MTTYLLDVNLLIALCDSAHAQHDSAHRWYAKRGREAWATCPITENGLIRIASHPNYPNRPGDAGEVVSLLKRFCEDGGHEFWPDDISLRDVLMPGTLVTSAQTTDIYLLALAAHHGGKLATFDRRISTKAVRNGTSAIEIITS